MNIDILPNKKFSLISAFAEEFEERYLYARQRFLYLIASSVLEGVLDRIPSGKEWEEYRKSLLLSEIMGISDGEGVAIRSKLKPSRMKKSESGRTVLYIEKSKRLRRSPPEIAILMKYMPWTLETIPIFPNKRDASIITRKVSKREVDNVDKQRRREKSKWEADLKRAGIKESVLKKKKAIMPVVVRDLYFEAVRLELGINKKARPHWSPSLRNVRGRFAINVANDSKIKKAMLDFNWKGWKSEQKLQKVPVSLAKKVVQFQQAVSKNI